MTTAVAMPHPTMTATAAAAAQAQAQAQVGVGAVIIIRATKTPTHRRRLLIVDGIGTTQAWQINLVPSEIRWFEVFAIDEIREPL